MAFRHAAAFVAAAFLSAGAAVAQDQPKDKDRASQKESEPTSLKVGDKAPELHIARWVKGEPVTGFEKGKTYIVEYWATWCGPCIQSMPHLSEIQKHFGDKVTVIGVTSEDSHGNTLDKVEKMVADKGDDMAYTVAWDEDRKTNDAYMKAAKQPGIPTAFVVDGTGKVVYIGHPMWLDKPLEQITAGTWDPDKGMAEVKEAEGRLMAAFRAAGDEPEKALAEWEQFEKDYPAVAAMFGDTRYALLVRAKDPRAEEVGRKLIDEAIKSKNFTKIMMIAGSQEPEDALETVDKFREANPGAGGPMLEQFRYTLLLKTGDPRATEVASKLVDEAIDAGDPQRLNEIAWAIVNPEAEVKKRDLDVAMKAAKKAVDLTDEGDGAILDTLARVYAWKGDYAKALELQKKAVDAADDPRVKEQLEKSLKEYEGKVNK
jgi:thiol-disulfide isomerase/thioredoxin